MAGAAGMWASRRLAAQPAAGATSLTSSLTVFDGGSNIVAFKGGEAFVLVDSGGPKSGDQVRAALGGR